MTVDIPFGNVILPGTYKLFDDSINQIIPKVKDLQLVLDINSNFNRIGIT